MKYPNIQPLLSCDDLEIDDVTKLEWRFYPMNTPYDTNDAIPQLGMLW